MNGFTMEETMLQFINNGEHPKATLKLGNGERLNRTI
jgi:hypothetical protein